MTHTASDVSGDIKSSKVQWRGSPRVLDLIPVVVKASDVELFDRIRVHLHGKDVVLSPDRVQRLVVAVENLIMRVVDSSPLIAASDSNRISKGNSDISYPIVNVVHYFPLFRHSRAKAQACHEWNALLDVQGG